MLHPGPYNRFRFIDITAPKHRISHAQLQGLITFYCVLQHAFCSMEGYNKKNI
jgi:hypothetical protein